MNKYGPVLTRETKYLRRFYETDSIIKAQTHWNFVEVLVILRILR